MKSGTSLLILLCVMSLGCSQGLMPLRLPTADPIVKGPETNLGKPNQEPTISFTQVQSFALQSCAKCHSGDEQPALFGYNDYRQHADEVLKSVVIKKTMPRRSKLTDEQIQMVKDWIEQGTPEHVPNEAPEEEEAPVTTTTTTTLPVVTTTLPAVPSTTTTTVPTANPPGKVDFATVQKTSFVSCTKCHYKADDGELPYLETYADYKANLKDVEKTVVVKKSMPRKEKLTEAQIQLVKDWLAAGAPEK